MHDLNQKDTNNIPKKTSAVYLACTCMLNDEWFSISELTLVTLMSIVAAVFQTYLHAYVTLNCWKCTPEYCMNTNYDDEILCKNKWPINGLQTEEFDVTCQSLRNVNELLWASHYSFVVQFKSAIDFILHASLKIRWSNQGDAFYFTLKKNRLYGLNSSCWKRSTGVLCSLACHLRWNIILNISFKTFDTCIMVSVLI